ncbi:MAG: hypothetical protein KC478_10010 [Bacteriovoracaceae bacterium]|nr:hypothetical protein [Bacteriovoracaceae bacterium]
MLDKFEKLENFVNAALIAIAKRLKALWLLILPAVVLTKWNALKKKVKLKINSIKMKTASKAQKSASVGGQHFNKLKNSFKKAKSYPVKQKSFEGVGKFKTFLLKTPLKNHADAISKYAIRYVEKLSHVFKKLSSPQAMIAMGALMMISMGTYGIYVSSEKIYTQEWPTRAPASQDKYLERPDYLKYPKRTLKVFNVKIPIYVEDVRAISSVTVDFTVRTSTRFAKQYLEEYEYKLKDYFFMTTEPVISTFPLKHEGKSILKEKIQDELNVFLEENQVEGQVQEVDIIFIVGS